MKFALNFKNVNSIIIIFLADVHGKTEEMWQAMEPELTTIVKEHLEEDAEDDEEEDCQEIPEDATVERYVKSLCKEYANRMQIKPS